MNIRTKLIMCFIVPVLFIIILGVVSYGKASDAIINNYEQSTVGTIHTTGQYYELMFQNVEEKTLQIANDEATKNYHTGIYSYDPVAETSLQKKVANNLFNIGIQDTTAESFTILAAYGDSISTFGKLGMQTKTKQQSQEPFVDFTKTDEASVISDSTKDCVWTGYHQFVDGELDISKNKYGIAVTRKFYDNKKSIIGYVISDINMTVLKNVMDDLELPDGSVFGLISPDGREIVRAYHKNDESEMNTELKETSSVTYFTNQTFHDETVAGDKSEHNQYVDYNGEEYLYIYKKVGDTGALVSALIPKAFLTSQSAPIRTITIIIALVAVVLAVLTGAYMSSDISSAIKTVISKLSLVADGDLTIQVETNRKDEFKVLSDSINHMVSNMKSLIDKAVMIGNTVSTSASEVSLNSEVLMETSKNITLAINEIQQGIIQQASDSEECLKQTDDLSKNIDEVTTNTNEIQRLSGDAKSSVNQGIITIEDLKSKTSATSDMTKETIIRIEELVIESNSIGNILAVINDIAEQTNLLSLNASIEAARAGEAGKGFSVVAGEIRKLAEKSMESAKGISCIIDRVHNKIKSTVDIVKDSEKISITQAEALHKVVQVFHDINTNVESLVNNLVEISEGVSDIEGSKDNTLRAIESISAIAQQTAASSEEVNATASEQLEAVSKMNETAIKLGMESSELRKAIEQFKI
jgi:methyl-accepting chemotaxis protein